MAWSCVILLRPGLTFATAFNYGYGGNIIGLILRIALQITIIVTGCCVLKIFPERKFLYKVWGADFVCIFITWFSRFAFCLFGISELWKCYIDRENFDDNLTHFLLYFIIL